MRAVFFLDMPNEPDAGAALRASYEEQGGVQAVFGPKVADYVASRPDYPVALLERLRAECPPADEVIVADVGAGTGLLTHGLLQHGYRVVAVEPNAEMRRAADGWLGAHERYRSVAGGGEALPLAAGSVDLITVAQAFHWLEVDRARTEFLRVLKPRGLVALIWNLRVEDDALQRAIEKIFDEFGGAQREALVAHEQSSDVPRFFGAVKPGRFSWPHAHRLDEAALASLVFSRSYMPGRTTKEGDGVVARVHEVFRRFAAEGTVEMRYRTVLYLGRPG